MFRQAKQTEFSLHLVKHHTDELNKRLPVPIGRTMIASLGNNQTYRSQITRQVGWIEPYKVDRGWKLQDGGRARQLVEIKRRAFRAGVVAHLVPDDTKIYDTTGRGVAPALAGRHGSGQGGPRMNYFSTTCKLSLS
jgi:hypothetical protein